MSGRAVLCPEHAAEYQRQKKNRNRPVDSRYVTVPLRNVVEIYERLELLDPMLGRLTRAYNAGEDIRSLRALRDEVHVLMLTTKMVVRDIVERLPDPRID